MVFLGDAGVVVGDRFLCSRFRHPEREPEADHYAAWFAAAGTRSSGYRARRSWKGWAMSPSAGGEPSSATAPARTMPAWRRCAPSPRSFEVVAEVDLPDPRFYHLAMAVASSWTTTRCSTTPAP